jgi:hypothetical protein
MGMDLDDYPGSVRCKDCAEHLIAIIVARQHDNPMTEQRRPSRASMRATRDKSELQPMLERNHA